MTDVNNTTEPQHDAKLPVSGRNRSCNGCRASEAHNDCSLGYACKDYRPLEPCPKPKTIKELLSVPSLFCR